LGAALDAIEAIRTRRSIRDYQQRPIERRLIEDVIEDAAHAPPPFSGQVPWTFTVIEGLDRIAALGARAMAHARDHNPAGGTWAHRREFKAFWNAPVVVIISGRVEDCCRAGQNLMLSAHARGLGTCWVGSPMLWLQQQEVKAELGIPSDISPVSVFCLGYPNSIPDPPTRARPMITWTQPN